MNHKRAAKIIISWLILFSAYLKQDVTIAVGQPVLPEAKTDAAVIRQEQIVFLAGPVRLNPFLSFEEEGDLFGPKEPPAPVVLDYFNLSAIFCSQAKTENKAIINGMICKVGDEIDANSKKIVEIQPRMVTLKDMSGQKYLLILNKGSEK
ncbi:MAG: hypothetical protein AABZ65_02375 [Candidatus Omnitrophota bacterium]